ncbi:11470_t:CDS:2 [Entrophospora sp. SA101]|nr:11470_t:CDS:2 [Entrophospora sp. SA101]
MAVLKGRNFEQHIKNALQNHNIDLLGGFVYEEEKYLLLIQCKVSWVDILTLLRLAFLEAELAPSNIILTNQVDIYHDLCRFVVFLKEKIILKRSSEKMELKKEMQEEIEKELWAKVAKEFNQNLDRKDTIIIILLIIKLV